MTNTFTYTLAILFLFTTTVLAQKETGKTYTARVNSGKTGPVTKRDKDEITFQAKNKITNLANLLNVLNTTGLGESEKNSVIQNSYLPNQDQIFVNDAVVIEDDVDPRHFSADSTAYLKVERYLRDVDLFYEKSDSPTISFERIITSPVLTGKDYPYIKVFFISTFAGKHNQLAVPYRAVQRVAELRADKADGKWRTLVTRLGFVRAGEGLTELSEPVLVQEFTTNPRIKGSNFLFVSTTNNPDSITIRWDQRWLTIVRSSTREIPAGYFQRSAESSLNQEKVGISLKDNDDLLTFRRIDGTTIAFRQRPSIDYLTKLRRSYRLKGWLQVIAGAVALGTSYAGYQSLRTSYDSYASQLNTLNAEYTIWQTLSQQSGNGPAAPMPFNSYAQPGIYAVYGGGIIGSGLVVNGIRQLLKAGKISKRIKAINRSR